jgi:hypothetical protein
MKRLSLAELKAKATTKTIVNSEVFTGGEACNCHNCIVKNIVPIGTNFPHHKKE